MKLASPDLVVPESISRHPYVDHPGALANELVQPAVFKQMSNFCLSLLNEHESEPIDMIVGDDVSGRVPTIVAREYLKLGKKKGLIKLLPGTIFVASGRIYARHGKTDAEVELLWANNLREHLKQVIGDASIKQAVIITEQIESGDSIRRITDALTSNNVNVRYAIGNTGHVTWFDQPSVGVEKSAPDPVSRRHPDFDGRQSAKLRHFLGDYAKALYDTTFSPGDETPHSAD